MVSKARSREGIDAALEGIVLRLRDEFDGDVLKLQ